MQVSYNVRYAPHYLFTLTPGLPLPVFEEAPLPTSDFVVSSNRSLTYATSVWLTQGLGR